MGYFFGKIFRFFLVVYVGVFAFHLVEPFPRDLEVTPETVMVDQSAVSFLGDVTYTASSGAERVEERIFPAMLEMVRKAEHFVFADIFLFNQFQGKVPSTYRDQTGELAEAFVAAKRRNASTSVTFLTDPINRAYGGMVSPELDRMASSGVVVVETPLGMLPESNLLWGTVYQIFFRWFPNSPDGGWLPNPLYAEGPKVTLRTYAALPNFKANHRKVLVADEPSPEGSRLVTLVGSLNPHTASSRNWNAALRVSDGRFAQVVLAAEQPILARAGVSLLPPAGASAEGPVSLTYLTESSVKKTILAILDGLNEGERADIAAFYLSDRGVIRAIERARDRGVALRILLDPNEIAFGRNKYGVPNRQTVERLLAKDPKNMTIRWCNTHGEQCHAKMLVATGGGKSFLLVGSANFTRRNLGKYNLESAILVESASPVKAIADAYAYMDRLWRNERGETSLDVEKYRDRSWWKRVGAAVMEWSGLSTF